MDMICKHDLLGLQGKMLTLIVHRLGAARGVVEADVTAGDSPSGKLLHVV